MWVVMNYENRSTHIDLNYLHALLVEYEKTEGNTKEKINIRNAIMELVQPGVTSILLTYVAPLDEDMFQDSMLDLIKQIDGWDSSRTKRKLSNDPGDWAFFVICIHNFCRNYVNRKNKLYQREMLIDPLEQAYWGAFISRGLPEHIYLVKVKKLSNKRLQEPYRICVASLLGEHIEHDRAKELKIKLRDRFGLTHQETKEVIKLSHETIKEHIEGMQYD